jgi:hypothetical protein
LVWGYANEAPPSNTYPRESTGNMLAGYAPELGYFCVVGKKILVIDFSSSSASDMPTVLLAASQISQTNLEVMESPN